MNSTTHSNLKTEEASELSTQQAKIEAVVRSLRALLEGDEKEQQDTFNYLKQALDEDRPSNRRLFK